MTAKGKFGQVKVCPASTAKVIPVIYEADGEDKNRALFAISSGFPILWIGKYEIIYSSVIPPFNLSNPSVPPIKPGHIPTTLTPFGPNYTAICLVSASTPAFAVPAWVCNKVPL